MEDSNNSEIYDVLVKISQGEKIDNWEVQRIDGLVSDVRLNESAPGKSRVKLTFDSYEDYWKLFDLTTDDIWFANAVFSHYDTFEFESEDWADDDWKQGYLIREFNSENLEKLKEILIIIGPKYSKLSTDEDFEKSAELLTSLFERQSNEIKYSYMAERNRCKERGAIQMIENETCNAFQNYGIFSLGRCFYSYVTTVSVLLSLYKLVGDTSLDLSEMLEKIGKDNISIGGDWYNYMYEQDCVDYDEETFNRDVAWELERIMTKIEEDGNSESMKEFYIKLSGILDKYEMDKWYNIPKDENLGFRINDVDSKENKIIIQVKKQNLNRMGSYGEIEKRSYDIDDFNTFLYQPELFESRKFGRLK
jgi:hypothetical protein